MGATPRAVKRAERAERQADLWYPTFVAMFLATGEDPERLSISLDGPTNTTLGAPTSDPLEAGRIVSQEIDATADGYRAQINHPFFLGDRGHAGGDYYLRGMEIVIELFKDAMSFIVPGRTTTGELCAHYAERALELGAEDRGGVALHSSGLGDLARPRLGPRDVGSGEDDDIVIVPGMTFDFKPAVRLKPETVRDVAPEQRVVQIGEHVLVTAAGVERLGRRELAPIFIHR